MTPAIEEQLRRIGWSYYLFVRPFGALHVESVLSPTGGLFAPNGHQAGFLLSDHLALLQAVKSALSGLRDLSPEMVASVNIASSEIEERDAGVPDRVGMTMAALEGIVPGLLELSEFLKFEAEQYKGGRPKNHAAYSVAKILAEVYVIGLGEKPTYGVREDGTGPSGLFGSVVQEVFRCLDLKVNDVSKVCKAVVQDLSDERMKLLLSSRERHRGLSDVSAYGTDLKFP